MPSRVILLAGLPGSGKTPYLETLRVQGLIIFDDYKANAREHSPDFRKARGFGELIAALRREAQCVVADMAFCRTAARSEAREVLLAEVAGLVIEEQFFESSPEQCEVNIRQGVRPPEPRLAKLAEFAPSYTVPDGAVAMPVWKGKA